MKGILQVQRKTANSCQYAVIDAIQIGLRRTVITNFIRNTTTTTKRRRKRKIMSTTHDNAFDNITNNNDEQSLNYLESSIQQIIDDIQTTNGLVLWTFVAVSIVLGFVFNALVLRSILRIKCNGK